MNPGLEFVNAFGVGLERTDAVAKRFAVAERVC